MSLWTVLTAAGIFIGAISVPAAPIGGAPPRPVAPLRNPRLAAHACRFDAEGPTSGLI
jgi:hypothetical protein